MAHGIDLGIAGRVALVCGSSSGLGRACAEALGCCGAHVVLNGRNEEKLRQAAAELSQMFPAKVSHVAADIATPEGRERVFKVCAAPDILVNNTAGPPAGDFREFDESMWHDAVRVNMLAPIMMIRGVLDAMIARRWGRIINITSSAVKAPLPLLGLSNGARSGLTGFVAGLAREVADKGVTINNLLPGPMETQRLRNYIAKVAASRGITPEQAASDMADGIPVRRFGKPEELGAFCVFLASRQAAYITGQNILLDGGQCPS